MFNEGQLGYTVERVMVGQDKLVFEFKDGYTTEYKLQSYNEPMVSNPP